MLDPAADTELPANRDSLASGAHLGRYRIERELGAGGMGKVYAAFDPMLGRRAAIKVLRRELSQQSEIAARFLNEARAAAAIADPGIVQIFDIGRHTDGSAFIVMELLDGEPLDQRLARFGALTIADALRITRQAASTLGAAHARGIVHRDIKPENIFLARDPEMPSGERTKILDFGIAKLLANRATHTAVLMGTPLYMCPEQCEGAPIDARADVYALGCVLFALITGEPPFAAGGLAVIAMHLHEPPPLASKRRPGVSVAVDRLIMRCMAKNPDERYACGAALAAAIDAVLVSRTDELPLAATSARLQHASMTTLSGSTGQAIAALKPGHVRSRARGLVAVASLAAIGALATVTIMAASPSVTSTLNGASTREGATRGSESAGITVTPLTTSPPETTEPASPPPHNAADPADTNPPQEIEPARTKRSPHDAELPSTNAVVGKRPSVHMPLASAEPASTDGGTLTGNGTSGAPTSPAARDRERTSRHVKSRRPEGTPSAPPSSNATPSSFDDDDDAIDNDYDGDHIPDSR